MGIVVGGGSYSQEGGRIGEGQGGRREGWG